MPKSILAAINLTAPSEQMIAAVQEYAKAFTAKVYLVHVTELALAAQHAYVEPSDYSQFASLGPVSYDRKEEADRLRNEHRALQALKKKLSDTDVDATALLIEGATVEKLLLEIDQLNIDLVIIGSHTPSFLGDLVFGSTTKGVLRKAGCQVLVLPPQRDEQRPV